MFRDQYKKAVDEITSDKQLLEKVLFQAASKKPPVYRKRMLRTFSAAAASVAVISTGILTLPSFMDMFRTPSDTNYEFSSFVEENTEDFDDSIHQKNSEVPPSPPASSSSLPPSEKNTAVPPASSGTAKPKAVFSVSPATKQPSEKKTSQKTQPRLSKIQDQAEPVKTSAAIPSAGGTAATASPQSTPTVPPASHLEPAKTESAGSLPDENIPSDNQPMTDSAAENFLVSSENTNHAMSSDSSASKEYYPALNINIPKQLPADKGTPICGGGGSSSGSAALNKVQIQKEFLDTHAYCTYLGINIPEKVSLPEGMSSLSGTPSLSYVDGVLTDDRFTFSYSSGIHSVSITTSKLDFQIPEMLDSTSYDKTYTNGAEAVVLFIDGTYHVYLYYMDVAFTIQAENFTEKELSVLLSSLTA